MPANNREQRQKKIIEVLNKARAMELYAISQYMHQHYNLDDMDYGQLAAIMKLIAIDEMRHAEMFAERIKELGGDATPTAEKKIVKAHTVEAMYPFDSETELDTIDAYNQFANVCTENGDHVTTTLFQTIINEENMHQTYFDNIAKHIKTLGNSYLSKIAGTPSTTGGAGKSFALGLGVPANTGTAN